MTDHQIVQNQNEGPMGPSFKFVGWPDIFPDMPKVMIDHLSFLQTLADFARKSIDDPNWIGNDDIARGQAAAYEHAAEMLVEDLARAMHYYGDGDELVWTERR